jgi:hypothetical protein
MSKKWLGIILSIILLLFSINGLAQYTYTQQSGTGYFVSGADKSDALEDTIEVRMILDSFGSLLGHSKYDTTYPKDGDITVGYLSKLNSGLDAAKPALPAVNDMYLATDTTKVYKCFVATNWVQVYPDSTDDLSDNSIADLSDVAITGWATNKLLKFDATGNLIVGTDNDTTYTSSDFTHDNLTGVSVNEHIDWTIDQGATNIHSGNYVDTNTTYTAGTGLDLTTGTFSLSHLGFEALIDPNADRIPFWNDTTNAFAWKDYSGWDTDASDDVTVSTDLTDTANLTYDTEWNTLAKIETATGVNIIDSTENNDSADNLSDDSINALNDVYNLTPADKNVLIYDGVTDNRYENRALSSDDLTDVSSIAMLDENEMVTGNWNFKGTFVNISKTNDDATNSSMLRFNKSRDGDPTNMVSEGDYLGEILFLGYIDPFDAYKNAAEIRAIVDGTPGSGDMPGRLEFLTTPDGSATPALRMAIDNAGNVKMGDGAWTNYVNIDNSGKLDLYGTANIEGVNATEFSYLDGVTSDIQTQLNAKEGTLSNEAGLYSALSDVSLFLEDLIDDTTPELGGHLDAKDKNIKGMGRASFTQEYNNGSKTASFTVDFANDQKQKVTLTANTMTLTLDTTSVGVGNYLLKIVNGGLATLTWASESGSVYWPGGTEPDLTSSGTDIVSMYFDGSSWYCQAALDFE